MEFADVQWVTRRSWLYKIYIYIPTFYYVDKTGGGGVYPCQDVDNV